MKKSLLTGLLFVTCSAIALHSLSDTMARSTVKSCTDLLPEGHKFDVVIDIKIDTTSQPSEMMGALHMSDGTQERNPELSAQVASFKACVVQLMK